MRDRTIIGFAILLGCCLAAMPALADEGRIPLWESTFLGPGSSGKYIVTRNITAIAGGTVISISGTGDEEIDIDLDGKTLFGDPSGGPHIIEVKDIRTLVLRDGSLRAGGPPAGGNSVHVEGVKKVIIEDLRIEDGGHGIRLREVPNFAIRRNIIVGASPVGIYVDGAGGVPAPVTGFIEDNLIKDAADVGIFVFDGHSSTSLDRNRIDRTGGGPGIWMGVGDTCKLAENVVEASGGDGIFLEFVRGCKIYNNVTSFNHGHGIHGIGTGAGLFLDNVSSHNDLSGIELDGDVNHIDRNVLNVNGCFGLHLIGPSNTYGRNTARSNAGAACGAACGAAPLAFCPVAGGSSAPDLCVDAPGNTSFCDNLMPGPPTE